MYDKRHRGFVTLPRLIWKTSFPGSEPKNNYFLLFTVYDVNRPPVPETAQPTPAGSLSCQLCSPSVRSLVRDGGAALGRLGLR